MTTLTDLPKDVMWIIFHKIIVSYYCDVYETETVCTGSFFKGGLIAELMLRLASVSVKCKQVLQLKCEWHGGVWFKFKKGSI